MTFEKNSLLKSSGSILLIHGSAPFNEDGNVPDKRAGRYEKTNFYKDLADELTVKGFKVFRYSKLGVSSSSINFDEYKKTDLQQISSQLNSIWNSMPKDQPRFVFAWSEGSLHIHLLPMQEINGVIILGGVATNIKDVILSQAKTEEDKKIIESELMSFKSMPRYSMIGIDRPVGRLVDEFLMNDNWTYFKTIPNTPILILHSKVDQEVPFDQADTWKRKLPNNMITLNIYNNKNHSLGDGGEHGAGLIAKSINSWLKNTQENYAK